MKVRSIYFIAAALLLFCVFSFFDSFEKTESSLEDRLLQSPGKPDNRIQIIAIDEQSLEKLGQWPWSRNNMAQMIKLLTKGKSAVIGIDVMYSEYARDPEEDRALAEAIREAGNVVLPVAGNFSGKFSKAGEIKAESITKAYKEIYDISLSGHINNFADFSEGIDIGTAGDAIIRKALLSFRYGEQSIKSFDWVIADKFMRQTEGKGYAAGIPVDPWNRYNITYTGGPGKMNVVSFYDVLSGAVPPEYFENSIVLIGPYAVGIAKDYYLTPIDYTNPMYGVEIHANIIQNLLQKEFKTSVPYYINMTILILAGLTAYLLFRRLDPAFSAISGGLLIGLYIGAAKLAYGRGFIIQILYPAAFIVISYFIILACRYIEEYLERRRITGVFGRYVAPQVVDEILKSGEEGMKLGGARKEISALFVDIRGFTPMSEKVEPEQVVEILNDYLNLTATSIFRFGGTLDKFIGDATMAIFNAPMDLEDHAFKAVQTAWAMKEGSEPLQRALREKFGRSVQFGIGINTGFAVVGNIGAKFRMDYTAIGDTVNTAARLESNAKPGQILMSEATYERVRDRVQAAFLGEITVKGKEQGIPVYQLDGIGTGASRVDLNDKKLQAGTV